ncbi:MAG: sigma-54 dependent transcriptional regulator [Acidobacteriia bacterium]|nr:sigma-54 dependent transcriptional regulator [Terriglobia bacterium]
MFAASLASAVDLLGKNDIDAIVLCLPIVSYSAEELVRRLRASANTAPLFVYDPAGKSGCGDELIRLGAAQYITDTVPPQELLRWILPGIRCKLDKVSRSSQPAVDAWQGMLVGSSSAMRQVIEIIRLVGPRRSTVLISGETGSGKEIAARAIHAASNRSGSRMVAINCAALPDHLLEAELFGHTKGAFTGAVNARVGLFEQAHRSTIFLDEIGEMPLQLQAKLLRVLQEREIQRIGSSEPVPVDVRVIAASNSNLLEAVANRRFREDLYYRLNVVALKMPPLRDRASDILELAAHFLVNIAELESAQPKQLSPDALDLLMRYSWPGNVRQLEHALESAVALSGTRTLLHPSDLDLPADLESPVMARLSALDVPETGLNFEELIMGIERRLLERALAKSGGNKARAASMLQMKRTTLISKFKALEVCA